MMVRLGITKKPPLATSIKEVSPRRSQNDIKKLQQDKDLCFVSSKLITQKNFVEEKKPPAFSLSQRQLRQLVRDKRQRMSIIASAE